MKTSVQEISEEAVLKALDVGPMHFFDLLTALGYGVMPFGSSPVSTLDNLLMRMSGTLIRYDRSAGWTLMEDVPETWDPSTR